MSHRYVSIWTFSFILHLTARSRWWPSPSHLSSFATSSARRELTPVSYTEQLSKWMEKGSSKTGRAGTQTVPLVPRRAGARQSKGQCGDIVPLCGDLSLSFLYTCGGRCHHSPAQGTWPCSAPSLFTCCLVASLAWEKTSPSSQFIWSSGELWDSIFFSEEDLICLALNTTLPLFHQRLFKLLLKYCPQTSIMAGIHRNNAPH